MLSSFKDTIFEYQNKTDMKHIILVLGVIVAIAAFLSSCSMFEEPEFNIPSEFQPYVENFFKEAELRGFNIRTSNLQVIKEKDLSKNYSAKAMARNISKNKKQLTIVFDEDWANFNLKNYPERVESVMFHELGHGVLKRDHSTTNGCYSLMFNGGCITCYENNPEQRKKLLDELFFPCDNNKL